MALNSIDRANYINQSSVNGNAGRDTQVAANSLRGGSVTVNARDIGLATGQTFSGQVVEVEGRDVKLLLDNNQTINARLDGNLNAILGQTISFEVSSTEGGHTSLRPLYTNLSNMTAISNALRNAGMPENPAYVKMVSSMMDEGMSVNKEALWGMAKDVNAFPGADPSTLVQLAKLSLPINELTVNQFENYKNFEYQIKEDVNNLSNGLVDMMDEALTEANPDFYEELSNMALEAQKTQNPVNNLLNAFLNAVSGNNSAEANQEIAGDEIENTNSNMQTPPFNTEGLKLSAKIFDLLEITPDMADVTEETSLSADISKLVDNLNKAIQNEVNKQTDVIDNEDAEQRAEAELLNEEQSNAGELVASDSINTPKSINDVFNLVKNLLNQINENEQSVPDEQKRMLSGLLSNKDFKGELKDALSKQLTLKPEDVTSNSKVEELYNKILKQSQAALDIANSAGKDNPDIAKAAQNLNDNVNFMNQLNQAVTYIQIPLLMNNQSAHGDLYVYTNKKNLAKKDGNLSALLHLDMDNLGPMDVYVALKDSVKVNTHFYLQDEATIDFIAKHIDLLNERLTNKGYDMNTNISVKDKKGIQTSIAEEFLKESPEAVSRVVSKLSFDVRA